MLTGWRAVKSDYLLCWHFAFGDLCSLTSPFAWSNKWIKHFQNDFDKFSNGASHAVLQDDTMMPGNHSPFAIFTKKLMVRGGYSCLGSLRINEFLHPLCELYDNLKDRCFTKCWGNLPIYWPTSYFSNCLKPQMIVNAFCKILEIRILSPNRW